MFYMFRVQGEIKEGFYNKARQNSFLENNSRIRMDRFEEGVYFGSLKPETENQVVEESHKVFKEEGFLERWKKDQKEV